MKGGGKVKSMKKEDFHVGQKVWVYLTRNAARWMKPEERIQEWEVVSVGRKYITVARSRGGSEVRFNADEGFRQENPGGALAMSFSSPRRTFAGSCGERISEMRCCPDIMKSSRG